MKKQVEIQKQICKIQIWGAVTILLSFMLSVALSCLMWYSWQLHPLLVIFICLGVFFLLAVVNHAILSAISKSLCKKTGKYITVQLDASKLKNILTEVENNGVLNITKQNHFLFIKSTIDNIAFYDAQNVTSAPELKGLHTKNINSLKKKYPDVKNKDVTQNHLRLDVSVFVVDKTEHFLEEYLAKTVIN